MAPKSKEVDNEKVYRDLEELKSIYCTTDAVFAGVVVQQGWSKGKMLTEEEYEKAVEKFIRSPLGRR